MSPSLPLKSYYGKLKVVKISGIDSERHILWSCLCQCQRTINVPVIALKTGFITSCGICDQEEIDDLTLSLKEVSAKLERCNLIYKFLGMMKHNG